MDSDKTVHIELAKELIDCIDHIQNFGNNTPPAWSKKEKDIAEYFADIASINLYPLLQKLMVGIEPKELSEENNEKIQYLKALYECFEMYECFKKGHTCNECETKPKKT